MQVLTENGLQSAIVNRKERLSKLDQEVPAQRLIERLKSDAPWHPYIMLWQGLTVTSSTLVAGVGLTLVLPLFSMDVARMLMFFDSAAGMSAPALLGTYALAAFLIAQGARQLVIFCGASSPLLHDELSQRLQLQGEIVRLSTVIDVRRRTVTPAPARMRQSA